MIVLAARPCWANSSRLRRKSCLSSGPCTHVSPHTSGGTTRAIATRSSSDSLAPALFALGQHDALAAAARQLEAGEFLAAFLDDIYVVTSPPRARGLLDAVTNTIELQAGVAANLGKTHVYHARGGPAPPGIRELGEDVWRGDKPPAERGFVALGVPIGHHEFIRSCANARLEEERRLLTQLPQFPDLQCAWLLLLFCAAPRAQHLLRTAAIVAYARDHDEEVWRTLQDMLRGHTADAEQSQRQARDITFLPASLGGLGLMRHAFARRMREGRAMALLLPEHGSSFCSPRACCWHAPCSTARKGGQRCSHVRQHSSAVNGVSYSPRHVPADAQRQRRQS